MMMLKWLKAPQKRAVLEAVADSDTPASSYLITGGADIEAEGVKLEAGARVALVGEDAYRKHYFCDWLLGFVDVAGRAVRMRVGDCELETGRERAQAAAVLGRSPLLYGETIQEALLYRTHEVRKHDLFHLVERFYGPSLRSRTSPLNPLLDAQSKPLPTQILTAREHLEIAQINVLLQKTPVVILDLSSELMAEAISEGFRPAQPLFESGKTILAILPPGKDLAWAEQVTGTRFSAEIDFTAKT
ncbi:MAG: hypothetical protein HY075_00925 [Deltaproteobacteria bacterium]|nr:hypothetical protein [Deltaproteobacteria bacterium]